jgi:beta-glucosidase
LKGIILKKKIKSKGKFFVTCIRLIKKSERMKKGTIIIAVISMAIAQSCSKSVVVDDFKSFVPPVSYDSAENRAEAILSHLTIDEKIDLIGGHNMFFVKGIEAYKIPRLYLSDATQGVHLRKNLDGQLEKSTAFPCPISLAATWNPELANKYARCIGEECRAGDIAILLGPGMNIYRESQNGRNFEYFGEDPFLTSRMIENYVTGVQSTGTISTLKHFICNNTDYRRRTSNSVVDERTLHEIYLPGFKAGVDAGAMAVMTSYNQVNGEWAGQSDYVINQLLRKELGFKWLVMSDWWSIWDPEKAIKSGTDLDMPGHDFDDNRISKRFGNPFLRSNAKRLLEEGKVQESDINRMAKQIILTELAMELDKRPVKDTSFLRNFPEHVGIALQTAREGIVLLKNSNNVLPFDKAASKNILITGKFVDSIPMGGGSAEVLGYDNVTMLSALSQEFGESVHYIKSPTDEQIQAADKVIVSVGTKDSEGWDSPFELPGQTDSIVCRLAELNKNVVVVVNSGRGIKMTAWNDKVSGIIYAWYPGQTGFIALAEIISGKTNPSGKLPITIEKKFEDSPAYPYIPKGESFYTSWDVDFDMSLPVYNNVYDEGVFVGYRWYESKHIEPLYPFGYGLSYTSFEYSNLTLSADKINSDGTLTVEFNLSNSGKTEGAEIAQLYIQDLESSVERPIKELKGFRKIKLLPGESKFVKINLKSSDFAFWDVISHSWKVEPGEFKILVGSSSKDIRLTEIVTIE